MAKSGETTAGQQQRGRPFPKGASGNPAGRPPGARHKTTIMLEQLMVDDAERVTKRVVQAALQGNMQAAKLILDRAVPPRKDRAVTIDLPALATAADVVSATARIIAAVSAGALTPDEGTALAGLVELHRRAIETGDHEQRLASVEARLAS
jgi:hypothetical protein